MAKGYFTFKQFTVAQDKAAMKVCTDSCLFGAYIPLPVDVATVLDIGTGTGLLTLMLVQRGHTGQTFDAVEIDAEAAAQARLNFSNSPWSGQLNLYESSIQDFAAQATRHYDLIVCNPPFYAQSLQRPGKAANLAMHSTGLSQRELAEAVLKLLSPGGQLAILLPPYEMDQFVSLCEAQGLFVNNRLEVWDKEGGKLIRVIAVLSRQKLEKQNQVIAIKDAHEQYTAPFAALLKEYYLIF
jgi:tRNA1Val (adenine37-N6)-methyltransferase